MKLQHVVVEDHVEHLDEGKEHQAKDSQEAGQVLEEKKRYQCFRASSVNFAREKTHLPSGLQC